MFTPAYGELCLSTWHIELPKEVNPLLNSASCRRSIDVLPKENIKISLINIPGVQLLDNTELLAKLAKSFSTHYGTWSKEGPHPGQPVTMSVKLLKKMLLFDAEASGVVVATPVSDSSQILGHAFYYKAATELGKVCWITQLVTHCDNRHKGISSSMINAALRSGEYAVCGLVTSHPYAIRALEKATASKCDRIIIDKYGQELIKNCNFPYIDSKLVIDSHGSINTKFHVDHTELLQIIQKERNASRWDFGELLDGHEFFAFVFINSNKERHQI